MHPYPLVYLLFTALLFSACAPLKGSAPSPQPGPASVQKLELSEGWSVTASPEGNGTLLVSAFEGKGESRRVKVEGVPIGLFRDAEGRACLTTVRMTTYSFGHDYKSLLTCLTKEGEPDAESLGVTVLKPATPKLFSEDPRKTLRMSISPLGDEILFTRLHDPPAYPPYWAIVRYHIPSGTTVRLFDHQIGPFQIAYHPGGEHFEIRYGDSISTYDLWTGQSVESPEVFDSTLSRQELLRLRSWRIQGLIDERDYRSQKQQEVSP